MSRLDHQWSRRQMWRTLAYVLTAVAAIASVGGVAAIILPRIM